jgi:hypothetical protein
VVDADQAGNGDYQSASTVTQQLTVAKAPQAIAFTSVRPAAPTYGGSYTVVATGGPSGNPVTVSVDPLSTVGVCSVSGLTVSFTGAGPCQIDISQAGSTDYQAAPTVTQSFTIDPAVVRVDANPASATYGQPDPASSGTLRASDFQYSDTSSSVGVFGSPSCQVASHSQNAGTYGGVITCGAGSLSSADYTFVRGRAADLTIEQAGVHLDANPASATYGQPDPIPSATLRASDFQYSDTASAATGAASCRIASHSQNAGSDSGAITCQPGSLSAPNYTFVSGTGADLTISQAVVHVDADSASKTYGNTDPAATATLRGSDFQYADTASVASGQANCRIASHSQNAGSDSGAITCQSGSLSAADYTFVPGSAADLTIEQA